MANGLEHQKQALPSWRTIPVSGSFGLHGALSTVPHIRSVQLRPWL